MKKIVILLLLISSVATKAQLIYSVEIDTLQYPHVLVLDYNTGSSSTDLDSVTHVYDSLENKYIVNAYFSSTTGAPSFEGSGKQELIPLQKEFPFDISINMYKEIDGSSILLDSAIYADNEVVITGTSTNHVETITNMSMAYGNSHDTITINVNQFYACDNIENTDIEYDSESNTRIIRLYFESGMCYNYGQLFEGINGEKVIIEASEPSNLKIYTIYSDNRCEEEYITDSLILSVDDIRGDDYFVSAFTSDTNMGIVEGRGFYDANTNVTLKAVANENYVFERWNDGNTDNPRTFAVTRDTTFTAYFAPLEEYSVEVYVDDLKHGTVEGNGVYYEQSEVTISAQANEGYHFQHWNDSITTNPRTIVLTQDTTFTAHFGIDNDSTVGINAAEANTNLFTLSPNPTTKNLHIDILQSGNYTMEIYSAKGVEVKKLRLSQSATIDCTDLVPGTYMVKLYNDKHSGVKTFVKQ